MSTGELRVVEIRPGLLVREDGMVKNISGHGNSKKEWHTGSAGRRGYRVVAAPCTRRQESLHRLVAEAFIPNPDGNPFIDHINGYRYDNRVVNLRWVSNRENQNNQIHHRTGRLQGCCYRYGGKKVKRWQAYIQVNGTQMSLGYYHTELEAHQAYVKYREENGLL